MLFRRPLDRRVVRQTVKVGAGETAKKGNEVAEKVVIGNAELWHGDCREVLPLLPRFDAVVTDPPYGLDIAYASFDDTEAAVADLAKQWLPLCLERAEVTAFSPGKRNEWLYPRPTWVLGWASKSGQGGTPWGFPCYWPILVYGADPFLKRGKGRQPDTFFPSVLEVDDNGHPCPKPLNVMVWLIDRVCRFGDTVLDPFMGSGTTGVACAQLGKAFTGIERERKYFDIACERISRAQAQGQLLPPETKPAAVQEALL